MQKIPVNVITGFLGSGKTTLVRELAAIQQGKWAVLVNEFGEVGLDGGVLESTTGGKLVVLEVAGGCMCCTAHLPTELALSRVLRTIRPERLLIEPSGLGHPGGLLQLLQTKFADAISLEAVLTLVNPAQYAQEKYRTHSTYADQIQLADRVLLTHLGQASPADITFTRSHLSAHHPSPIVSLFDWHPGTASRDWLDLPLLAQPQPSTCGHAHHAHGHSHDHSHDHYFHHPEETTFGYWGATLSPLAKLNPLAITAVLDKLPEGSRAKAVLPTGRQYLLLNGSPGHWQKEPIAWARQPRIELFFPNAHQAEWQSLLPELAHHLELAQV
jgi:G3E family GTPase